MEPGNSALEGPNAFPNPTPPRSERWGVGASVAWAIGAGLVTLAAQIPVGVGFIIWWRSSHPGQPIVYDDLAANGALLGFTLAISTPVMLAFIAFAVHLSRIPFTEYLALRRPRRRDILIGFGVIAILLPLSDLATILSGREAVQPFMIDSYESARDAGTLFFLLYGLALLAMAPVGEEILFRGFLHRGFARGLGIVPAVILTSVAWAALHVQYELFILAQILVLGLAFGWLRARSGSVLLTIGLHFLINGVAFLQTATYIPD